MSELVDFPSSQAQAKPISNRCYDVVPMLL